MRPQRPVASALVVLHASVRLAVYRAWKSRRGSSKAKFVVVTSKLLKIRPVGYTVKRFLRVTVPSPVMVMVAKVKDKRVEELSTRV
jgi:hypothetical protein